MRSSPSAGKRPRVNRPALKANRRGAFLPGRKRLEGEFGVNVESFR
jgi:hypothetical protein